MIQKGASSSIFLLLGGVASLPGASIVRSVTKKTHLPRKAELDADWEWMRLFGSAAPAIRTARQIRSPRQSRAIPPPF